VEDFLVPIIITTAVSLVLALFFARAKRQAPVEVEGFTVFKSVAGGSPIRVSPEGLHYESWGGWYRRFIRWEDIVELEHNTGSNAITVRARDKKKIVHQLHAAPDEFKRMVQQRTKLPLTIATPGVWRVNKTQVPYHEEQ
jgi:hypothetical protein